MVNIAFFGTPDFAVPSLDGLLQFCHENKHNLSFIVCQPDKPAKRGKHLQMPAIKLFAQKNDLKILQPHTLKKASAEGEDFF
ncbi:MAG: methionyl-tRNA formyltransferase, partial [bacterium]|nr:methionyl-tRNA formyltransferase [bacterium]